MLRLIAFSVFGILPAVGALAYTAYLAYARFDASYRGKVMDKLALKYKGTPFYDMRMRAYSTGSLIGWVFITFVFILGIVRYM